MTNDPSSEAGRREERRRGITFLAVVMTVFMSGTWVACATWGHFARSPVSWALQIVPYIFTATFIFTLLAAHRVSSVAVRLAYRISAVWLGWLNFFLFAAIGCWITDGFLRSAGFALDRRSVANFFYGLALLAGVWGLFNGAWLRVTRRTVRLPGLPVPWRGKEVVLVTDLHLGNIRRAPFMRRVVKRIRSLKPHAVFISGDLFDGPKADYGGLIAPGRELSVPGGIYFVTGNHEEFSDRGKYITVVEQTGIRVLHNEMVTVDGFQILGVHDGETMVPERFRKILRDANIQRQSASILLAHRPGNLSIPEEAGISLQVSGHTHKGQIWPWCWVIFAVHGPFAYGLNRHGNLQVITSSGAGSWGPPMRVGTKSEIVLIRLEAES